VFRIFWGVSNLLGCFESFGVFRIFWGVSNLLGCFESFGGCFRLTVAIWFAYWGVLWSLGCNYFLGGVLHIWATVHTKRKGVLLQMADIQIPNLLDWAPPPIKRRPRMGAAFEIIFFKERRLRMSAALNSVIIFRRQNGDILWQRHLKLVYFIVKSSWYNSQIKYFFKERRLRLNAALEWNRHRDVIVPSSALTPKVGHHHHLFSIAFDLQTIRANM
jgi:hypothetical protein